ncbi:MAG: MmcQ/YjbR family DNA-binding protein [Phycisphaeraceae bacterium]|nr:MmcQ/YjbR family DNA-binding protein [Phycisphaerales bacterium]MCB9859750.1 MmcQ/YjbR family DNA-binding protein [Phycisphaeraceae bacterium]
MAAKQSDPTEPMRIRAGKYAGVDEGTACTQSSFKVNGKAFLFVGMQGGRSKAMFKLRESMPQAVKLAEKTPDDVQVGSTGWVTARFSAEKPMPKALWEKWLDESYQISNGGTAAKKVTKKTAKKSVTKKTPAKKTGVKKSASKKTITKKRATKRKG